MKKQVFMGMAMVVAVSFSTQAFAVGVRVEAKYKEAIDLKYKAKETKEVEGKTVHLSKEEQMVDSRDRLLKDIDLGGANKASINATLKNRPEAGIELLKAVAGVDMLIANSKSEAATTKMKEGREALLAVLESGVSLDAYSAPSNPVLMTEAQFKSATEAYDKLLVEMAKAPFTYESAESAGAFKVAIALKAARKANHALTAQEALVEAIAKVKTNGDRAEALKLIEKYKDCV